MKLAAHHPANFHGVTPPAIEGYMLEIRHAKYMSIPYAYVCYCDKAGQPKWKITPANFEHGRPHTLHLYHRNWAGSPGFHHQGKVTAATVAGLGRLVEYIRKHDKFEKTR